MFISPDSSNGMVTSIVSDMWFIDRMGIEYLNIYY